MSAVRIELFDKGMSMGSHLIHPNEQLVIGSSKNADFIIPGSGVAGIHALIRVKEDSRVTLFDLGSPSGTFVNERRIVEAHLNEKSSFKIGEREIILSFTADHSQPEKTLFWENLGKNNGILHILSLNHNNIIQAEHLFSSHGKIKIPTEWGFFILERKGSGFQCSSDQEICGEIYSETGILLEKFTSKTFEVHDGKKLRVHKGNSELQIFWTGSDSRIARSKSDADASLQWKTFSASAGLFLSIALSFFLFHQPTPVQEEALIPKSDYTRVTMESSAPQGGPENSEQQQAEQSTPASNSAPSKTQKTQSAVSQMLNKFLEKPDPNTQIKIGTNGTETVRGAAVANSKFSQQAVGGNVNAGGLNAQSINSGLQSAGGGSGKGLNGFNGKGVGGSGGLGSGTGMGNGGFGVNLGSDEAEAVGGLDKALIAAVVQANIGQIKHCYERQLLVDNSLAGKVVAGWVIDAQGSVSDTSIKKTTLNSTPVENCIQARIKTWKFPQPKGGGKVIVSYPFLLKALN